MGRCSRAACDVTLRSAICDGHSAIPCFGISLRPEGVNMANRLVKFALVLLAVTAVSLILPHAAYADCTATASGSLSPGAKSELTCDGTTASAAGTLMNGSSPACGKLTLRDLNANVLVDR